MSDFIKWKKPNGDTIETNSEAATIAHCKNLGWKPKRASKATNKGAE